MLVFWEKTFEGTGTQNVNYLLGENGLIIFQSNKINLFPDYQGVPP